jgi:hypothetical protein
MVNLSLLLFIITGIYREALPLSNSRVLNWPMKNNASYLLWGKKSSLLSVISNSWSSTIILLHYSISFAGRIPLTPNADCSIMKVWPSRQ